MPELLKVEKLRVRFRTAGLVKAIIKGIVDPHIDAVMHVSFSLMQGETFGLVGESGSGKTTLGRAVIGLVEAAEGSITVDGHELIGLDEARYRAVRRNMAMMFQDPVASLSPRKTVRNIITEPFRIHGIAGRDVARDSRRLLNLVGLHEGFLGAYPHQLSGGQARRVGVARALALEPRIIIADEPTAGLDVSVQGEILNLMNRLQRELGLAYLIITHNLPVVRHVSDRLAIMYLGRFVETGTTQEIFTRPAHPYTLGLLAAVPEPDPDKRRDKLETRGRDPVAHEQAKGLRVPHTLPLRSGQVPVGRSGVPGGRSRPHGKLPLPLPRSFSRPTGESSLKDAGQIPVGGG